jgi:SAM-dependent methyltransferase
MRTKGSLNFTPVHCRHQFRRVNLACMDRSAEELAQTARLEDSYELARSPVIQNVTDQVCGCGYIGVSNATRFEADEIIEQLKLNTEIDLLELGAGAGWPGLYFAKQSGCKVTLLDLPETGLQIARERALEDRTSERVQTVRGDASILPFGPGTFEAITHSDMLCCLLPKKRVLAECRRVIAETGCMAFSVVDVSPGLSKSRRAKALEAAPEFVDRDQSYVDMLGETGWRIINRLNLTPNFERTYEAQILTERRHEADLRQLRGDDFFEECQATWAQKLAAVRSGLLRRDLYLVAPF